MWEEENWRQHQRRHQWMQFCVDTAWHYRTTYIENWVTGGMQHSSRGIPLDTLISLSWTTSIAIHQQKKTHHFGRWRPRPIRVLMNGAFCAQWVPHSQTHEHAHALKKRNRAPQRGNRAECAARSRLSTHTHTRLSSQAPPRQRQPASVCIACHHRIIRASCAPSGVRTHRVVSFTVFVRREQLIMVRLMNRTEKKLEYTYMLMLHIEWGVDSVIELHQSDGFRMISALSR